jgi:MOSC domain-containing protein YiiM
VVALARAELVSVNLAVVRTNPFKNAPRTGIDKQPTLDPVEIRAPGSREHGRGSGLVGDFIGDRRSHGGDDQAVYAYAIEDYSWWDAQLGTTLTPGAFGENLTISGLDVNASLVGERWTVGESVELQVTDPRIPCATFRGWMNRPGWLKTFTAALRPGPYLRVTKPGTVCAGDPVEVSWQPDHDVTMTVLFRALTTEPELIPRILEAPELPDSTREWALERRRRSPD